MSLTTDDLREALAEAAGAPYDPAGAARLHGVRARVRRTRRRRVAVTGAAGVLTASAVVAAVLVGGSRTPTVLPARPTPTTTQAPSLLAPLPALYTGLDVVAQLDGADDLTPAKQVAVPAGPVTIAVRCAAPAGQHLPDGLSVTVTAAPAAAAATGAAQQTLPCLDDRQVATATPRSRAHAGTASWRLQAHFDRPVPAGTAYSVALLSGAGTIDLSGPHGTPKGYRYLGSYALSDGWVYASGTPASGAAHADQVESGVQIALEKSSGAHLLVRCIGRQTLTADGGAGPVASVSCPAGQRVSRRLDLPLAASGQQVLGLRVGDADPGALLVVSVSAR